MTPWWWKNTWNPCNLTPSWRNVFVFSDVSCQPQLLLHSIVNAQWRHWAYEIKLRTTRYCNAVFIVAAFILSTLCNLVTTRFRICVYITLNVFLIKIFLKDKYKVIFFLLALHCFRAKSAFFIGSIITKNGGILLPGCSVKAFHWFLKSHYFNNNQHT